MKTATLGLIGPETAARKWIDDVVREEENQPYLEDGRDFIDDGRLKSLLVEYAKPEPGEVRDIIAKSLSLERLEPQETAALLNIRDQDLWQEVFEAAARVKNDVYGPRIVTFAPLYCSNLCVNSCVYCGFRTENRAEKRRKLSFAEIRRETEALVSLGHKRLIVVYGEHPDSGIDYIAGSIKTIYDTKVGRGEIRRVNINAAPQSVENYRVLKDIGIGTYQVFQETYHHDTYRRVHPRGIKANYAWRLYALHRAQEAGVDDVAIGTLFGLYDWRFEVLGLLCHAIDLEEKFGGVGPHTISFPRITPAADTPFNLNTPNPVSDEDFLRLIAVIRLSVPYTGMIITAREPAHIRRRAIDLGCTQTDGSTRIGIGAYAEPYERQEVERQQFTLGDPRSLDEVVREMAGMGYLTSFCTAGYRCGRTGNYFMDIAKKGKVHLFCIPNAILTMKEYLLDYASAETREIGEKLIERHKNGVPTQIRNALDAKLSRIENGERDLYF
jgi:2-iminoacetate synthase